MPGSAIIQPRPTRRLLRRVQAAAAVGVLGVGVLLSTLLAALWLEHRTALALPAPTGPYAVGRTIEDWRDGDAPAPRATPRGARGQLTRELLVWVWYPAAGPRAGARGGATPDAYLPYLPAPVRPAVERARGALISTFLTRDLARVRAHSLVSAPVAPARPAYPVVLLRGGASAAVWSYTVLAEDLASHGYVVVGFDAPYRTQVVAFPNGRVIRRTPANDPELAVGAPDSTQRINRVLGAWTGDLAFVLDRLQRVNAGDAPNADASGLGASALDTSGRFTGRLDLARVGVIGHSLGGATALQFCHDDPRCTAGVDIDGAPLGTVVRDGVPRPFLFLLSDHRRETDPESRHILATIQSLYDRLPPAGRELVTLPGANHFLFSDDGALLKSHLVQRVLRAVGVLGMDGRAQLAATATAVRRFLAVHFAQRSASPDPAGRDAQTSTL